MKTLLVICGFLCALLFLACSKQNDGSSYTADCSTAKSYATDVSPVIQSYCNTNSGCHASGSHEGPGALTTYQQVYNSRSTVRSSVANGSMPQGANLTAAQKNAIICWIDSGAPNN